MACLLRAVSTCAARFSVARSLCTTSVDRLKQLEWKEEGNTLTVSARAVPSPRQAFLVQIPERGCACSLCALNLNVKHTDVLILSQFMHSNGRVMTPRLTGLCRKQQKYISRLVAMAHMAGLMPCHNRFRRFLDPKKREGYKKFNKYYDETTIKSPTLKGAVFFHNIVRGAARKMQCT